MLTVMIKPQFGIDDASKGWVTFGSKTNDFKKVRSLNIDGQIRDFGFSSFKDELLLITTINNDSIRFYKIENKKPLDEIKTP